MAKNIIKRYYQTAHKEEIHVGQIMIIKPTFDILDKYKIVKIISQEQIRKPGATSYVSCVKMKKNRKY